MLSMQIPVFFNAAALAGSCVHFRELISDMAVVEWSDIQIKGISPGQTPEPSVEVFSRVRCATSVSDYLPAFQHGSDILSFPGR